MTSTRKLRKLQARWDNEVRGWASDTAKALTLTLYQDTDPAVAPYNVGVVLNRGEKPWVQIPARCSLDQHLPAPPGSNDPPQPAITPWLVTNRRIVGRFAGGHLRGWSWEWAVGCLVDLTLRREYVHLDIHRDQATVRIDWYGPGVAPLAVAAVYHLHGAQALLDHPGLAPLRSGTMADLAASRANFESKQAGYDEAVRTVRGTNRRTRSRPPQGPPAPLTPRMASPHAESASMQLSVAGFVKMTANATRRYPVP